MSEAPLYTKSNEAAGPGLLDSNTEHHFLLEREGGLALAGLRVQGLLANKGAHLPTGVPRSYVTAHPPITSLRPWHRPTVGSQGGAFSHGPGTPVGSYGGLVMSPLSSSRFTQNGVGEISI